MSSSSAMGFTRWCFEHPLTYVLPRRSCWMRARIAIVPSSEFLHWHMQITSTVWGQWKYSLPAGTTCTIVDLMHRPDLNGQSCLLVSYDSEKQRWCGTVDGVTIGIRRKNLESVGLRCRELTRHSRSVGPVLCVESNKTTRYRETTHTHDRTPLDHTRLHTSISSYH